MHASCDGCGLRLMSKRRPAGDGSSQEPFEPNYIEVPAPPPAGPPTGPPTGPPVDEAALPPTSGKSGCSKWLLWLLIIAALVFGVSKCGDSEAVTLSIQPVAHESQQISVTRHLIDVSGEGVVFHGAE